MPKFLFKYIVFFAPLCSLQTFFSLKLKIHATFISSSFSHLLIFLSDPIGCSLLICSKSVRFAVFHSQKYLHLRLDKGTLPGITRLLTSRRTTLRSAFAIGFTGAFLILGPSKYNFNSRKPSVPASTGASRPGTGLANFDFGDANNTRWDCLGQQSIEILYSLSIYPPISFAWSLLCRRILSFLFQQNFSDPGHLLLNVEHPVKPILIGWGTVLYKQPQHYTSNPHHPLPDVLSEDSESSFRIWINSGSSRQKLVVFGLELHTILTILLSYGLRLDIHVEGTKRPRLKSTNLPPPWRSPFVERYWRIIPREKSPLEVVTSVTRSTAEQSGVVRRVDLERLATIRHLSLW